LNDIQINQISQRAGMEKQPQMQGAFGYGTQKNSDSFDFDTRESICILTETGFVPEELFMWS
jgi:hypothetical protein